LVSRRSRGTRGGRDAPDHDDGLRAAPGCGRLCVAAGAARGRPRRCGAALRRQRVRGRGARRGARLSDREPLDVLPAPVPGGLARRTFLQTKPGGLEAVRPFNEREQPGGTRFSYASVETEILGLVLRGATGRPVSAYLEEKIWQPIGAEADATWLVDDTGQEST